MSKQPKALRLTNEADQRDFGLDPEPTWIEEAAAELRRLHKVNSELIEALMAFSQVMYSSHDWPDTTGDQIALFHAVQNARAVIAQAIGEQQ